MCYLLLFVVYNVMMFHAVFAVVFFNDENVNLAAKPEMKSLVEDLRHMLQTGWRAALPPNSIVSN